MNSKNNHEKYCIYHNNCADVSLIAKQYRGGGHKHASGFMVKIEDFPELFRNVSEYD